MKYGLGGRLPLLPRAELGEPARALFDRFMNRRNSSGSSPFKTSSESGELIGPFNACLFAPMIGSGFLDLHEAEEKNSPLSKRVREVIILSVGSIWKSDYELYAHRTLAVLAGFTEKGVEALATGNPCDELEESEFIAQRFTLELTAERQVSAETYQDAERVFKREGIIAMTFLAGLYGITCAILNANAIPVPS